MIILYTLSLEKTHSLDPEPVRACLPARYVRACAVRNEDSRLLTLAAGHLLLRELGIPGEQVLYEEPYGKPAAHGYPPFSLAHSGSYAVLAVNKPAGEILPASADEAIFTLPGPADPTAPVGVDIEKIRPFHADRMQKLLLPEEYAWVIKKEPADAGFPDTEYASEKTRFFTLWTLKESVCKACGQGLRLDPRKLDVLPLLRGQNIAAADERWSAQALSMDGHVISVCWRA